MGQPATSKRPSLPPFSSIDFERAKQEPSSMMSVGKALLCAVLLALPAAISCARSAPLQQQQRVAHLSAPSSAAQLSGGSLQQSLPGYDDAPDSDASLRPDLPFAGGVGTGVVGGVKKGNEAERETKAKRSKTSGDSHAAMVDKIETGFDEAVTVFLEEEFGYRYWIWRTGMTPTRLIVWWKALPTVSPYFDPSKGGLPGELTLAGSAQISEPGWWTAHLHMDNDSWLIRPNGTVIRHKGFAGDMPPPPFVGWGFDWLI